MESDVQLQYRRPTVRTLHWVEKGVASLAPQRYSRLAICQHLALINRRVAGSQGVV